VEWNGVVGPSKNSCIVVKSEPECTGGYSVNRDLAFFFADVRSSHVNEVDRVNVVSSSVLNLDLASRPDGFVKAKNVRDPLFWWRFRRTQPRLSLRCCGRRGTGFSYKVGVAAHEACPSQARHAVSSANCIWNNFWITDRASSPSVLVRRLSGLVCPAPPSCARQGCAKCSSLRSSSSFLGNSWPAMTTLHLRFMLHSLPKLPRLRPPR
jgi:hypothetical protein